MGHMMTMRMSCSALVYIFISNVDISLFYLSLVKGRLLESKVLGNLGHPSGGYGYCRYEKEGESSI